MSIFKNKNIEREVKDYFFITLGLILFSFGWTVFLLPYQIVTGGVTGVAAIIFYATGVEIEISYFIINALLLVVGLKILGWRFLMKTIYAIFMISFFLWLFQELVKTPDGEIVKILGEGQDFMSLLIGCTFTGSSLAIVFYNNGSTGGTDIIAASVNKYYNFSLGQVLIMVDLFIIGSCFFIPQFGDGVDRIHKVAFGLCTMVVENFVLDYVNNAMRQSVQFMIFSKKHEEIAYAIGTEMDHGVTILDGHGWYTGQDMKVLCILARRREMPQMFRIIKSIDPNAFVSVGSVIGVFGEGFDPIKARVPKKVNHTDNTTNKPVRRTNEEK